MSEIGWDLVVSYCGSHHATDYRSVSVRVPALPQHLDQSLNEINLRLVDLDEAVGKACLQATQTSLARDDRILLNALPEVQ